MIVVLITFVVLLAAIAVGTWTFWPKKETKDTTDYRGVKDGEETVWKLNIRPLGAIVLTLLIALLVVVPSSFAQVGAGERGVVTRFGAVTGRILPPGLSLKTPFVTDVVMQDVTTQLYEASASAGTKDLQPVVVLVTVNWSLDPGLVDETYIEFKGAVADRVIPNAVQAIVKEVTPEFTAEEMVLNRSGLTVRVAEMLAPRLNAKGLIVDNISITEITFSDDYNNAIQAKEIAKQEALTAENQVAIKEAQAKQAKAEAKGIADAKIEQAEGNKQAAILEAQGEATAILEVASAQAKANHLLTESITPLLNQYLIADDLGSTINTIILPTGSEFILGPEIFGNQ